MLWVYGNWKYVYLFSAVILTMETVTALNYFPRPLIHIQMNWKELNKIFMVISNLKKMSWFIQKYFSVVRFGPIKVSCGQGAHIIYNLVLLSRCHGVIYTCTHTHSLYIHIIHSLSYRVIACLCPQTDVNTN